ncbi:LemA family protein [Collimonas sp.]|jgi:LemA protein|uniref:LemA family protein n=1 Tax=Collimonas sp. TaxID=1963772 RepID=UPI002C99EDB2|nr:LemA family protein [Collimonas sp.]HWW06818.1 LemA family protein [Collimonas sp.]
MDDVSSTQNSVSNAANLGTLPKSHARRWLAAMLVVLFILLTTTVWYSVDQYNGMQRNDELVDAEWSHMLNQYARRTDLIPNLVSVAKSYATHESTLFAEIAAARGRLAALPTSPEDSRDPRAVAQFQQAQDRLSAPLSRLLILAESYPDLKASELFRDLMVQLEGTENRISYARQRYIAAVAEYNLILRRFPSNLIGKWAGYKVRANLSAGNTSALPPVPKVELE